MMLGFGVEGEVTEDKTWARVVVGHKKAPLAQMGRGVLSKSEGG